MLVVEDVHWSDEATLDVLRFLARRIDDLPAVLVLTYRTTSSTATIRCAACSATWARRTCATSRCTRLSAPAVGALTADSGLDPDRVFG